MPASAAGRNIATLPQAVADRIAAGEVVERPAAVAKELIENSLDAGADRITIVVKDAGRTLIRVVDNGSGMTSAELTTAIGRHATSKLRRIEDLETLTTFGFRGEALPSIAAVSRLEIVSRSHNDDVGTLLKVAGGHVEKCDPTAAQPGSSVSVSHLFYNVPARRKFLRSDTTEFKWIATTFRRFAIAFPDVAWEFYRDDELIYQLPSCEPRERMAGLLGDDVAEDLVEIDYERGWLKVSGFISPPSLTQRHNFDQFLFLNRRPITSARLNRAVYNACEPHLVAGGHPIYCVQLQASPDRFDINVHPAKKEVKFVDESGAFSGVWAAVRNSIAGAQTPEELKDKIPHAEGDVSSLPPEDGARPGKSINAERAQIESPSHLTPFIPIQRRYRAPRGEYLPFPGVHDSRQLEASLGSERSTSDADTVLDIDKPEGVKEDSQGPVIWQIFDTFIVSPLKTGLVFIDQHIAHERILYEKALSAMDSEPWSSQQLLFPVGFNVRPEDVPLVEEALPLIRAIGFAVESFGRTEFRILAVPAGIRISDEKDMILGIIHDYRETVSTWNDPRQRLAAAFACRGAVKAGQPLETAEMQRLIDELFRTEDPEFCPHGRPIYHVLNRKEIEKWFKR